MQPKRTLSPANMASELVMPPLKVMALHTRQPMPRGVTRISLSANLPVMKVSENDYGNDRAIPTSMG